MRVDVSRILMWQLQARDAWMRERERFRDGDL
jgi:hypothetical protein